MSTPEPVKLPCGRCGIPRRVIGGVIACPCPGPGARVRTPPQTGTTNTPKGTR